MNENYGSHVFESQILNMLLGESYRVAAGNFLFKQDYAYYSKKQRIHNYTPKSLNHTWFSASIAPKIMFA